MADPFSILANARANTPDLGQLYLGARRQRLADLVTQRKLEAQERQMEREERKAAARARILGGGGASAPQTPGATATSAPQTSAAGGYEAPGGEGSDIVVTASPRQPRPEFDQRALAEYAVLDPEGAKQIFEFAQKADEAQMKRATQALDYQERVSRYILSLPEGERDGAYQELRPEIEGMFPGARLPPVWDDRFGQRAAAMAMDQKAALAKAQKDREFALDRERFGEDKRHNSVTEGISRGQLEVAQGNLGVRRELAKRAGQPTPAQARRDEVGLRKEFNSLPDVKAFNDVRQSYRTIEEISKNPSAANDLALIFSYMKMLDPGSVVREGEFANAQNAAGVPDRIRNLYNKAISGERLNQSQREEFLSSAGDVYRSRAGRYNQLADQYRSYAEDYGADPNRVARPEAAEQDAVASAPVDDPEIQLLYDEFGLE